MRRHLGRTLALAATGLLAGLVLALRTEWAGEKVCAQARARLPALLGMAVDIERCRVDPLRGGVELVGARLQRAGEDEVLLAADRIFVRLGALEVVAGRLRLSRVELDRPRVRASLVGRPLGPAVQPAGGGPRCVLDELKRLEVDSLSINGGEVQMLLPGARGLDLQDVDLELRLRSRTYGVKLSVPRGGVDTGRARLPLSRLRVAASLDLAREKLSLKQLDVALGGLSLSTRGEVDTVCDPSLSLEASVHVPLDRVAALLGPQAPKASGTVEVLVRKAEGTLKDPLVEAEVSFKGAQVNQFELGDGLVEARLERERVRVDKLEIALGEGRVRAQGDIGLHGDFPVRGSVQLDALQFGEVLERLGVKRPWVDFEGSGEVEVGGSLAPFHLVAPASIDARDFRVWDRPFDAPSRAPLLQFDHAHVDVTADFNAERVRLGKARIRSDRSDVEGEARLNFDPAKGMEVDAKLNDLDLADLGHVVGIPWDGHLAGSANVRVLPAGVRIRGRVAARDFKFHSLLLGAVEAQIELKDNVLAFSDVSAARGRSRFLAEGQLDFRRGAPIGRGRGSFENARLSDLVEMVGDEHWIFDLARRRMEARVSGQAVVDGPLTGPRSRIQVALEDATYLGRRLGAGELIFRSEDGERIFVDRFDFDGPVGPIAFSGRVDLGLGMEFKLDAPRLDVAELFKPDAEFIGAGGALALQARLFGPPDHTQMTGSVVVQDLSAFGVGLGGGVLSLTLDNTDLRLKGPVGSDFLLDGRVLVEGDLPFALGVSATTSDLGHYVPSMPGLGGSLAGELLATGTLSRFTEARGDIGVSALSLKKGSFAAQNDGPIALAFAGSAVEVRSLALKGSTGLKLSAAGLKDDQGNLDLSLEGGFDARLIEELTSFRDDIEQAAGAVQVRATISGRSDRPTVVGTAESQNVRFNVRGYPVSAKGVKSRLEFSQSKVYLREAEASVNGGTVAVRGEVEMKDFTATKLDLGLHLDQVQYRYQDVPAFFTGDAHLGGPPSNLLLTGDMNLSRLHYTQDFLDLDTVLRELRRRHLEARSFEKKDEFLRYNLTLNVDDAKVENNFVRVALAGKLEISGTNANMGATGTLISQPGGRAFVGGNELALTQLSIRFTERDRIAEAIDLLADGQVRDYRIGVHIYGPLEDPVVDLTSEPSLPRSDVFTLLTLGVIRGEGGGYSTEAGVGMVGETLLSAIGLDRQFQRVIPKNSVLRSFNFHISTQYSVEGILEPVAQFESKLMTDALTLRLSQPVRSARGRRAQAEYRFDEHASAQMQWDDQRDITTGGDRSDLGLDLKLRWELE